MEFFKVSPAEGFEWINCVNSLDYEQFLSFDGRRIGDAWRPVDVRRVRADDQSSFRESDFPWLGSHALVMRSNTLVALRDLLESNGETLPLRTNDAAALYIYNAQVVAALDEELSDIVRFASGNVMRIRAVTLKSELLVGVDALRLPFRASPTFVSRCFVDRVAAAGLKGLKFDSVRVNARSCPAA